MYVSTRSRAPTPLTSHLTGPLRTALFGIYYSPHGLNGTSEITMGGVDTTKFSTPLNYASVVSVSGLEGVWTLASTSGSVNGQIVDILKDEFTVVFDSGTPNVVFQKDMAEVRKASFPLWVILLICHLVPCSGHIRCYIA
jgi:hypothetical protein